MSRIQDRQKAINLRKKGRTYSEIKKELEIPKSTLSNWLSNYPLSPDQLKLLKKATKKSKEISIERCRITKRKKREERIKRVYFEEKKELFPCSQKELYLAGLFLYLGEGTKGLQTPISLANTNPEVMKFYLYWLLRILKVQRNKIKVNIHLYSDMNIDEEIIFWSRELKLPLKQFSRPYIKESKRIKISHKGFNHGVCKLIVSDVRLKEKIMMGLEAIEDSYNKKI